MRPRLGLLVLAAALSIAGHAWADIHTDALASFERGRVLRDQAKYAEAAKEFEDSVGQERSVGGYYNLGLCLERLGRYSGALKAYRQSVALAREKGDPRAKEALDAGEALRARTHWVIVHVRDELAQTPGLRVELDGREVRAEDFGLELFQSASEHTLTVAAKDYEDLVVHPPDRQPSTIERIGKSLVGHPNSASGSAAGSGSGEVAAAPAEPRESRAWGWEKWTAIPLFIGGAIGVGYGIHYSLDWFDRHDRLQDASNTQNCHPQQPPPPTPVCSVIQSQFDKGATDAQKEQAISYTIGGALLLGGVLLFALSPGSATKPIGSVRVVPAVGAGQTGVTVLGAF